MSDIPDTLKTWPHLTTAILLATALSTVIAWQSPDLLLALQRSPTILSDGEIWRLATAFLVLGDNPVQIVSNSAGLALVGALTEWRTTRTVWAAAYLTGGVTGEIAGLGWKPFGAGNSVAVAGLLGLLLVLILRRTGATWPERLIWPLVGFVGAAALCYLNDIHGPPIFVGALVGLASPRR